MTNKAKQQVEISTNNKNKQHFPAGRTLFARLQQYFNESIGILHKRIDIKRRMSL